MEKEAPRSQSLDATLPNPPSLLRRLVHQDAALSLHLHTIFQPFPRSILKALEISGDGRFWFPVPVALFLSPLSSTSSHLGSIFFSLFIGSILDLLVVGLIKYQIQRPRPVYNKDMHLTVAVDHWSFPSGHSSRVCFIAAFVYLSSASIIEALKQLNFPWLSSHGTVVQLFVWIVLFWSVATSISRVLLGRHFVFDIVAGACLGVVEALLVFHFLNYEIFFS